jgi:MFS family permease
VSSVLFGELNAAMQPAMPAEAVIAVALPKPAADQAQALCLLFLIPYLNEVKDSWEFAAVPLHFLQQGWPIWLWGTTIAVATLCRLPMNALVMRYGDWLLAPLLTVAAGCAAYMLSRPMELPAVVLGVAAGHCMDTGQAEHSLCYRWCGAVSDERSSKRRRHRLRWMAFSATAGYSTGALFGGSIYELGGFRACAALQFTLCCSLAVLMCGLPVVHEAFREWRHTGRTHPEPEAAQSLPSAEPSAGSATKSMALTPEPEQKTISGTTGRFYLPVSIVLLCDGVNILAYVSEWANFALYYKQVFNWSSTLTVIIISRHPSLYVTLHAYAESYREGCIYVVPSVCIYIPCITMGNACGRARRRWREICWPLVS